MTESFKICLAALMILLSVLFSCKNFYISPEPRGGSVDLPGREQTGGQPGRNKYPANTGAVQVFSSMDELKGYNYEPLTTLTETNSDGMRTRAEMLASLQRRAAELGANAIAIVDEQGPVDAILRIRVNAVRILDTKEHTR